MKDMEVKQHVLDMLKSMIMGESGSKFKPVSAQIVMAKPADKSDEECDDEELMGDKKGSKPSLEEVLADAAMDAAEVDHEDKYDDEDDDNEPRGLKAFMRRK